MNKSEEEEVLRLQRESRYCHNKLEEETKSNNINKTGLIKLKDHLRRATDLSNNLELKINRLKVYFYNATTEKTKAVSHLKDALDAFTQYCKTQCTQESGGCLKCSLSNSLYVIDKSLKEIEIDSNASSSWEIDPILKELQAAEDAGNGTIAK